jgi:hypothetical protein
MTMTFTPFTLPAPRPPEPAIGTVLGFEKTFPGVVVSKTYSYAALHADPGWYLTGKTFLAAAFTWGELLDFIGGPKDWARVGIAIGWAPLIDMPAGAALAAEMSNVRPRGTSDLNRVNTSPAGTEPAVGWTVGDIYDTPNESGVRGAPPEYVQALRDADGKGPMLARDLSNPGRWYWTDGRTGDPGDWHTAACAAHGALVVVRTGTR